MERLSARWPRPSEKRVAPLELFFDLVFVFALTQVTKLMAEDPSWTGLGQGMLVLAALWWAWGAYAWLTNYIAAEEDLERLLMFAVMGAFLVAALAVPQAFGDDALLFAVAYAVARWLHIFIFAEANDDVDAADAIRRLARTALPAPALLIIAAFLDGTPQALLWVAALAIDFAGPFVFGVRGFRVSPGHFAERFALIVIIALGESIVAIGTGIHGELDAGIVGGGPARAGAGLRALVGVLRRGRPRVRAALPRDARRAPGARRSRLLQLPPPADDRGDRPRRARGEEGDRARRRSAQDRPGGGPVRRDRALLRRAPRLPPAERPHPQPAPPGGRCGLPVPHTAGNRGRCHLGRLPWPRRSPQR